MKTDKIHYGSNNRPTTISACMIVRNEEAMIFDCLASIRDVVDEIIIIDTGSTDRTIDIIKEATHDYKCHVVIYKCQWQEDFSFHRNQSIDHATSDWIFIIDADERLQDDSKEALRNLINKPFVNLQISCNIYNNTPVGENAVYLSSVRLFHRKLKLRYDGIIHNSLQLVPKMHVYKSSINMIHLGYNLSPEDMETKRLRTKSMLEIQIQKEPNNAYAFYNYGNVLMVNIDSEQNYLLVDRAIKCYRRAIDLCSGINSQKHILLMSFSQLSWCYFFAGQYEDAHRICHLCLKYKHNYLDPLLLLGHIHKMMEQPKEAIKAYENYLDMQEKYDPDKDPHNIAINNLNSRSIAEEHIKMIKNETIIMVG